MSAPGGSAPGAPRGSAPGGSAPGGPGSAGPQRRSGLRNPAAAVRGVGAVTLVLEAIVLLLALAPLAVLTGLSPARVAVLLALAAACLVLVGLLRFGWAWYAAAALQVAVIATGAFQWSLAVLGVVFLLIWAYVVRLRRTVTL